MNTVLSSSLSSARSFFLGGCASLFAAATLTAQTTYTVVDLTATGTQASAYAASGGQAAGSSVVPADPNALHAFLWTGNGGVDLHPSGLLGTTDYHGSEVLGFAGNLQVGYGYGPNTGGRLVALAWNDTAGSVRRLGGTVPTLHAQAYATDGVQIVGYSGPNANKPAAHATVWNAQTGAVTDLGDGGGNGALALGVARGQQVGLIYQSKGDNAALWNGTSRSLVNLHPKNYTLSQATATNGTRQVGWVGLESRLVSEGGPKTRWTYSAVIWAGTQASVRGLSAYPVAVNNSRATGVNDSVAAGYGFSSNAYGDTSNYHAFVWDLATLQGTDLNAFLPPGCTGATASGVDAQGNIAGTIFTANGQTHAAVWLRNP